MANPLLDADDLPSYAAIRSEHIEPTIDPVSYTHLDVYKRQVFDCKSTMRIAQFGQQGFDIVVFHPELTSNVAGGKQLGAPPQRA